MKIETVILKNPVFKNHKLDFINDGVGNFWVFRTIETQRSRIGHLSVTGLEVDKEKGRASIVIQANELIAIANFLQKRKKILVLLL